MNMYSQILLASVICVTSACQQKPVNQPQPVQRQVAAFPTIAPEVDNSASIPDCLTAGERIGDYVEIGMPKKDVRRLIGKPLRSKGGDNVWGWADSGTYPGVIFSNGVVSTYGATTKWCK